MTNFFPFVGDVEFQYFECTYDGSDNLIQVSYFDTQGGTEVQRLTMTYDGSQNLLTGKKTTP
jgi:hypothetical protein